jgi:hypothetical protein
MSRYEYRIAGVRLATNQTVAGEDQDVRGPAWSQVRFVSAPEEGTEGWLRIGNPGTGADVRIRRDGREAVIVAGMASERERARELRWAVPFIAGLQGETILHASAVERGGCLYAFVAESRTGKSTFSNALAGRGWRKLADDLLPQCLLEQARLAGLFFLQRPAGGQSMASRRLREDEALAELVSNGFGELAEATIWETHFRYYCQLLQSVPCLELTLPDGLERMGEAAAGWERMIEAEGLR